MFTPRFRKKSSAASQGALIVRDETTPAASSADAVAKQKAAEEQRAALEAEDLSAMLPVRKPKHLGAGVADGAKLIVGSFAAGAAALVAMPVDGVREGAKKGGAKGAAKGLVTGMAKGITTAVALPVTGSVMGGVQVVRGAVQTPFSIHGAASGKSWDKEARTWRHYSLTEEEEEVTAAEAEWKVKLKARREALRGEKAASGGSSAGGVEDTSFYDLLGVETTASSSEIKRAYLKLARERHPDKNPDDPQAKERFQKLGEAYQVLSNEDARAKYDAKGLDGLQDQAFLDPSTMYAMLFGSEKFDDLIGELRIAAMLQQQAEVGEGSDPSLKHMSHQQRSREVACARKLAERLQQYASGEIELAAFEADAKQQATELAQTSFGELLTHTIGRVYVYKASQALRMNIGENLRMKKHVWGSNAKALKAMIRLYKVSRDAAALEEEEQAKAMQKDMAAFLEGAWYVSVVDVESTLRHVCKKVLGDTSVPKGERRRRAVALKRFGEIFLEAASEDSTVDGKAKTLRERLEEMLPKDMAAADGAAAGDAADDDDDDDVDLSDLAGAPGAEYAHVAPPSREVLGAMSIRELKAVMVAQGLSPEGLLEKSEFVDAICASYATAG